MKRFVLREIYRHLSLITVIFVCIFHLLIRNEDKCWYVLTLTENSNSGLCPILDYSQLRVDGVEIEGDGAAAPRFIYGS